MFMNLVAAMLAREHTYLKTQQTVPFGYVQFLVGQYLNQLSLKKEKVISRPE